MSVMKLNGTLMKPVMLQMVAAAVTAFSAAPDSSDLIFNDTVVNRYRIAFYIPDWHDSLVYYKSNGEEYLPARVTWYGPAGDSIVLDSVGVRYKGNSSYTVASEKKPFKMAFDKYRKGQRFFSLETLNFSNCVLDPTMMREKIAYDVLGKYMPAPRAAFATLTVGDSLIGCFYTQVEQVDERFLMRHFGDCGGNLFKAGDDGASLDYLSDNKADYKTSYELKTNEKKDDWTGLISLLEKLATVSDADFVRSAGHDLDIDNCIRYLAFNMANGNFDSYTGSGRNYYLYDDGMSGKFKLIPWDVNLSFGAYAYSWLSEITTVSAFSPSNIAQRPLKQRILANDSLKRVYAGYLAGMIAGPLNGDSVAARARRYAAVIDPFVKADPKKFFSYEQFLRNIDSNVVIQAGPQKTYHFGLRWYTEQRNASLRLQIEKAMPVTEPDRRGKKAGISAANRIDVVPGGGLTFRYSLTPGMGPDVTISIFDARGKCFCSGNTRVQQEGTGSVTLGQRYIPAGCYLVTLASGKVEVTRTLVVTRK
jgi:hypothetical protein